MTSSASTKRTGGSANRVRPAPSHETYSVCPRAGRMLTPTPALPPLPPPLPPLPAGGRGWLRLRDCALSPLFNPLRFSPVRAHSHKHTYTERPYHTEAHGVRRKTNTLPLARSYSPYNNVSSFVWVR